MADDMHPSEAYGRFKSRFKPGKTIHLFYQNAAVPICDISDSGIKLDNRARLFEQGQRYVFDLIFQDVHDVAGWRVNAQCRWTSDTEAGFMFMIGRTGQAISDRIANQHLQGRLKLLNGVEL